MGLILDTNVFIEWERRGRILDFSPWANFGEIALSVITASELLVGVCLADTPARRAYRSQFVESILATFPLKEITLDVSRCHAELFASLSLQGKMIGAHDLWIAATAIQSGFAILTNNVQDFAKVTGLQVVQL